MASAEKTWRRFLSALSRAPAGGKFEVGAAWHKVHGWRCYQKLGAAMLFSSPKVARGMVARYRRDAHTIKQWKGAADGIAHCFDQLARAADDCDAWNRERRLPSGVVRLPGGRLVRAEDGAA